ncbi:MAG: hypothetical protein Q9161_000560, partial [Pseudevernia consocians]
MPEMWYYDIDFRCQVQEKEHGDEETKDVETRVGSFSVPSLIPIVKNPDSDDDDGSEERPKFKKSKTGPLKLFLRGPRKPVFKSKSLVSTDDESGGHP